MSEIMVSVCMLAYNHEKYIRKAIEGILMQKTNFKFELLIHDDASTDKTADIIREYEEKYPDIVKPIYQKENQYSKGVKVSWAYQYPRVKGKYIAFCEGDDYWVSPDKLQLQYDVMEKNESCVICTHNVIRVSEDEVYALGTMPRKSFDKEIIPADEIICRILNLDRDIFQTTSYFARAKYIKEISDNIPDFIVSSGVGDMMILLFLATKGDFLYINKYMSHYRVDSAGSYSLNMRFNKEHADKMQKKYILSMKQYNEYTNYLYDEQIQKQILFDEYKNHVLNKRFKELKQEKYKKLYQQLPRMKKLNIKVRMYSEKIKIPQLYNLFYRTYQKYRAGRCETLNEFEKRNNISY